MIRAVETQNFMQLLSIFADKNYMVFGSQLNSQLVVINSAQLIREANEDFRIVREATAQLGVSLRQWGEFSRIVRSPDNLLPFNELLNKPLGTYSYIIGLQRPDLVLPAHRSYVAAISNVQEVVRRMNPRTAAVGGTTMAGLAISSQALGAFLGTDVSLILATGSSAVISTAASLVVASGAVGFGVGIGINEGLHTLFPNTFASWSGII